MPQIPTVLQCDAHDCAREIATDFPNVASNLLGLDLIYRENLFNLTIAVEMVMSISEFVSLTSSLSHIRIIGGEEERSDLAHLLKTLNKCDFRHIHPLNPTRIILLVNQLCTLIPPDDVDLVLESAKLLQKLLLHLAQAPHVLPEGSHTFAQTLQWLQDALRSLSAASFDDGHLIPTLNALEALLQLPSTDATLPSLWDQLTGLLDASSHKAMHIALLQCLALLTRNLDHLDAIPNGAKLFADVLRHLAADGGTQCTTVDICRTTALRLRVLSHLLPPLDGSTLSASVPLLIGACRSLMLVGVQRVPPLRIAKVLPSAFGEALVACAPSSNPPVGQRRRKQRPVVRKRICESLDAPPTAPSGDSASDADGEMALLYRHEARVRHEALALLLAAGKRVEGATLGGYLGALLADGQRADAHYVSTCVLRDPSARCRAAALSVLQHVLVAVKACFRHAADDAGTAAFTPLSAVVAGMLRELHRVLRLALSEPSHLVLTQALKCLAALVQATPYPRLRPGLATKVVRSVGGLIEHKDSTVQVAALIVLGCLLNCEPPLDEIAKPLLSGARRSPPTARPISADVDDVVSFSEEEEEEDGGGDEELPWIIGRCIANASGTATAPVRLESLQVLAAMCAHHFSALVQPHLVRFGDAVRAALLETRYADVRYHAARAAEQLSAAMCSHACHQVAVAFWRASLAPGGGVLALTQCEHSATLRAAAADCLASVGEHVFDLLPHGERVVLVTCLLAACRDEEGAVRAAAVRALGVLVLFEGVRADAAFLLDAGAAIMRGVGDGAVGVRVKASWSLANLPQLEGMLAVAVRATRDAEKVQANAVRALGNLLGAADGRALREGVGAVVACATGAATMKVRWNACYALANVLRAGVLFAPPNADLGRSVLAALATLIAAFHNFKVRINAAMAVTGCTRRQYGDFFGALWDALLRALESAENVAELNEYQHRDHLVEQVCLAFGHLTSVMEARDLTDMLDTLLAHKLIMVTQVRRVYDRLLPEKTTLLLAARDNLTALRQAGHLGTSQLRAWGVLNEIFALDANDSDA